ncbi:MAG TPA: LptA/OstA family protein [Telmatospirillum sp.]|nr:LptA/OstA family protein [Telmatospirillum sp.]
MRRGYFPVLLAVSFCLSGVLAASPLLAKDKPATATAKAAAPAPAPAANDGGGFDFADQKSGTPLEIYADQGLELAQDSKTVIARVNAKAIRNRVTVNGDVLTAHYRPKAPVPGQPPPPPKVAKDDKKAANDKPADSGSSEVWRVEADGHVSIETTTQSAYGDHADYNIDDAVVVLTGGDLKLLTPSVIVTAKDSLEYWEHRQQAVARGSAVAVRAEKRIQADVLVADFAQNAEKKMAMQRAHGYDHVIITTPREVVTGDRADYNVETGIVTVTGSVKITREENQVNGGYAVVNLNTGISRVFPVPPGAAEGADKRVKALFVPQKKPAAADTGKPSGTP